MGDEQRTGRRGFIGAASVAVGAAAGLTAASLPLGGGPASAAAAATGGYPFWVGPAGSGAPFVIDPAVGAQQAINDALAAAGQGAVFVAGGTHPVAGPVVLAGQQALVGAGPLSTVLRAASGYTGGAMVQTSGTPADVRVCIADIGLEAAHRASGGVALSISGKPTVYGPDPGPWLGRVFVSNTTGDGIWLGGAYSGGQREFKITDCRVEHAGGWAYNLASSDGFVSGCSAQSGDLGGYNLAGGNIKCWGSKVYSTGTGSTPGPGFRLASARATVSGCEAQDTWGCGYEILGHACVVSGCTADSTGIGNAGTDRYSAGFYLHASNLMLTGSAYQRSNGGASWLGASGMRWALYLDGGSDHLNVSLSSDGAQVGAGPFQGTVFGTVGANSRVTVVG
ncbi:MAG TPA: hypothetical protein VFX70_13380 [Mycobacteriales bacterium]|nr:hypothetical protein [Mycobacteriales bacterium]